MLSFVVLLLSLVIGEIVLRLIENVPLLPLKMNMYYEAKGLDKKVDAHIDQTPVPPDVDKAWFRIPPPVHDYPEISKEELDLLQLMREGNLHPELIADSTKNWSLSFPSESDLLKRWNIYYLIHKQCPEEREGGTIFDHFPGGNAYYFVPKKKTPHPVYRFFPNAEGPGIAGFNQYGWRGLPISLSKPDSVIRIAFLGASTTQQPLGHRFAYTDYVIWWLNLWAEAKGMLITFEGINTGREGIHIEDIAAIMHQELRLADPDIVVYYEGWNDFFNPSDVFKSLLKSGFEPKQSPILKLSQKSLLFRRIFLLLGITIGEYNKPNYELSIPSVEALNANTLPGKLPVTLQYLDSIRSDAKEIDAELILSSFVMMVKEGMKLHPGKDDLIYDWWNNISWPLKYKDLKTLADFQNQVLEKYAQKHQLSFLEISRPMLLDPDFFIDGVHMRESAVPLRAWITFLELLPIIKERICLGDLPKPADTSKWNLQPDFWHSPSKKVLLKCDCPERKGKDDPYCLNHF